MDLRAAEDGFSRAAGAGSSRSGSFHLIQIVSRVCIIIRSALFWGQPPVSVGEYLAERKGYESRSADTNTRRIALFFMCSKTQCFCGGGGGFQRKHYPQNWSECSTVDLKFSSKYSTLFFYLLLGSSTLPMNPQLCCTHLIPTLCWSCSSAPTILHPEGSKTPFALGGSGVGAGWGTNHWERSGVQPRCSCDLIPVHDHMEPHGWGGWERGGDQTREAAS